MPTPTVPLAPLGARTFTGTCITLKAATLAGAQRSMGILHLQHKPDQFLQPALRAMEIAAIGKELMQEIERNGWRDR